MKWNKRSALELLAVVAIAAAVFVLGFFQFRWTGEISSAEQQRLQATLRASVRNFEQEFSYDFQQLCEDFEIEPDASAPALEARISRQYGDWVRTTSRPGLVAGVAVWESDPAHDASLSALSQSTNRFEQAPWPAPLAPLSAPLVPLRDFLKQQAASLPSAMPNRVAVYYPWTFYEVGPVLVRPMFQVIQHSGESGGDVRPVGFLVVELNGDFLQEQYLPDLVERHFGGVGARSFEAAVRTAQAPFNAIYVSTPNFPVTTAAPDATLNLFAAVADEAKRRGHAPLQAAREAAQWQLVAQHPAGSLEVAVTAWRRRTLAISFGLLALLAAGMFLIVSVGRRAERLARLQMEFVAGVSHELCTPLAVINSAAENLADGIVDGQQQVHEYGAIIREQGRRLERLVDEVLLFAAGRFGRSGYDLRPLEIASVVSQTLATSEPLLRDAGFAVEKEIGVDLPLVVADPGAVSKCIENLVSNAMKYAGPDRWIAVRARLVESSASPEVQIGVEDKGIGIPAADLGNVFEPFYRVQAVRDRQIRGVGLGLYLVRQMMEGMGGRVTVSSRLGRGTLFTLHFPVADSAAHPHGEAAPPRLAEV